MIHLWVKINLVTFWPYIWLIVPAILILLALHGHMCMTISMMTWLADLYTCTLLYSETQELRQHTHGQHQKDLNSEGGATLKQSIVIPLLKDTL